MSENKWFRKIPIGSNSIDASSLIDVNSTTKGARPIPSMSQAQRDAIISPATGLQVYNTTSNTMDYFNGTTWEPLGLESDIIDLQNTKQNISEKGQPNGYAPLNGSSIIPTVYLPSYVDDVLEFPDLASFPVTGETGKIYIALDTNFTYRWSGSIYVLIGGGSGASAGLKLLNGGSLQVTNSGGLQLSFTADFNIEKVGQNFSDNIIPVSESPILLPNSNDCAYVVPNDSGNLSVSVNTPNNVPAGAYIFARNQSGEIIVGDSMLIKEGEIKKLYYSADNAASSSGINYIINSQFEENILNVTSSANVNLTHNLGGALRGVGSLLVEFFSTAVIGNHVAIAMVDIDNIDEGKSLFVSFDYSTAAVTETDELQVVLYNLDAAQEEIVYGGNGAGKLFKSTTPTSFQGRVYLPTINNSYELRIKSAINRSATGQIYIDNVKVGPDSLVDSPIEFDFRPETITGSWTTNTTYTGQVARKGETMYVSGSVNVAGGAPAGTTLFINIPMGLTAANSKIINATIGTTRITNNAVDSYDGLVYKNSPTQVSLNYLKGTSGSIPDVVQVASITNTAPFAFGDLDFVSFYFEVPIVEWANSSAVLSTTEMMNQTYKAKVSASVTQTLITGTWTKMILNDIHFDDLNTFDPINDRIIIPKNATYRMTTDVTFLPASNGVRVSNVKIDGNFINESAAGNIGTPSDLISSEKCITLKLNKGQTVELWGYQSSGGDLNTWNNNGMILVIEEIPDFSVYSVYGQTDYKEVGGNDMSWVLGSGIWGDITSITLEPGEWDLTGVTNNRNTTGQALMDMYTGISKWPGNNGTDLSLGSTASTCTLFTQYISSSNILRLKVNITSTTTYYLKGNAQGALTGGPSIQYYKIAARKVK